MSLLADPPDAEGVALTGTAPIAGAMAVVAPAWGDAMRALFEQSPVGMTLSRLRDGRLIACNAAMATLLGLGQEPEGPLHHRDLLADGDCAWLRSRYRELGAQGRFGPVEATLRHRAGPTLRVMLSGSCVRMADGDDWVWTIVHDLSAATHLERRLHHQARTDALTGLPNRVRLIERIEACMARSVADPAQAFALMAVNIDRFKLVNDVLGHEAGDALLQLLADRLVRLLRGRSVPGGVADAVARLGDDQLGVLLTGVATQADVAQTAQHVLDLLAMPCQVQGRELYPSASIGIVLGGADSGGAGTVLRHADAALHAAKQAGRGSLAFFDHHMLAQLTRNVLIESALRRAIELDQLQVLYQPIVDLDTGALVSAEALVRWRHPELGAVSPAEFVPVAEDSGLIVAIGEWVLRQACAQWRRWQAEDPAAAPPSLSVNLSRVQMRLGDRLLVQVRAALAEHGMPPAALQLELTEREVMRDPEAARVLLQALRGLGVRLAMDDFGTGTSSLACLRDYPFDAIKIDKSFIDDVCCNSAILAVLQGTVTVIDNLGMVSVAEGIEQALQVGVLQSLGCRLGQGYYFARPVPGDHLLHAVAARAA